MPSDMATGILLTTRRTRASGPGPGSRLVEYTCYSRSTASQISWWYSMRNSEDLWAWDGSLIVQVNAMHAPAL
jgi:hypothetical protein